MPAWLTFTLSAVVVIVAGARLARDGDAIADRTGLGQAWVGAILVAGATSLPEIATDVAAIRQGDSGLAVGDLFGSSMANMLILGIADLLTRNARLLSQDALKHGIVGALAISLTAVAAAGVVARDDFVLFRIGWAPLLIGTGYILGMRLLHANRSTAKKSRADASADEGRSLTKPLVGFGISAAVILVAGPRLASSGGALAEQWGIASGFFGMVFLAAATSLPEASVVVSAVRAGAHTLAVGNLLGSNCFNMAVLVVLDVIDGPEPLLAQIEPGVGIGALVAIVLMSQVMLDLLNRSEHRIWYLEPGPALTVATYIGGLALTYVATH